MAPSDERKDSCQAKQWLSNLVKSSARSEGEFDMFSVDATQDVFVQNSVARSHFQCPKYPRLSEFTTVFSTRGFAPYGVLCRGLGGRLRCWVDSDFFGGFVAGDLVVEIRGAEVVV
jgi:hypothetical protein